MLIPKKLMLVLGLLLLGQAATAQIVNLCNQTPVELYIATAHHEGNSVGTDGWYTVSPGECGQFETPESGPFYYYAEANSKLTRWLLQDASKILAWSGDSNFCYHPTEAFRFRHQFSCDQKVGYQKINLTPPETTKYLMAEEFGQTSLENSPLLARDLHGRMTYERVLLENPGKEGQWQLGATMSSVPEGAQVEKIWDGMPAADEGLRVGDVIVELNGYAIEGRDDVASVLALVPFDQSEKLSITIVRGGKQYQGVIAPMFFPFNHPAYKPGGAAKTAVWQFLDGIPLLLGNEVGCGISSLFGEVSSVNKLDEFNFERLGRESADCAKTANRIHELYQLLYEDAAFAADMAALLTGVGGLAKGAKATKIVKGSYLAKRPRFVGGEQLKGRSLSQ